MRVLVPGLLAGAMALVASGPTADAQDSLRMAVSPALSPQDAGEAFERAVIDICIASISQGRRVADLPPARSMLSETDDPLRRQQAGAGADETVWDVSAARGVVTVKEKAGRCAVSVYGPPAAPTAILLAAKLSDDGFERVASTSTGGIRQSLQRIDGERQVQVMVTGSDPGSPGHSSRFSVVTATVFDMKAR